MNQEQTIIENPARDKVFPKKPFVFDRDDKITAIYCPACLNSFLSIQYNDDGGSFVCKCGFELK